MSMTDPIADFLARIRNGIRARKQVVECPRSNLKLRLAEILRDEGFVQAVTSSRGQQAGHAQARPCATTAARRLG